MLEGVSIQVAKEEEFNSFGQGSKREAEKSTKPVDRFGWKRKSGKWHYFNLATKMAFGKYAIFNGNRNLWRNVWILLAIQLLLVTSRGGSNAAQGAKTLRSIQRTWGRTFLLPEEIDDKHFIQNLCHVALLWALRLYLQLLKALLYTRPAHCWRSMDGQLNWRSLEHFWFGPGMDT